MNSTSSENAFKILAQGNDYLSIEATVSAINNVIYSASHPEETHGPARKELLSSFFNSAITTLYTPLMAVATDINGNGKISKEEFKRTLDIIQQHGLNKNSELNLANSVLFCILDLNNDGKVPTDDMICFIVKMAQQQPSEEAKEGVRSIIDPLHRGYVELKDFIKAMNM
ncbi:hypothetical protein EDI_198100 [Entamoeba dispar SAW760]|uniref:EF-hand domain-containing protein n=1 Tax=Entamoeba dispar (strain ATCC PRA-260 / SAW760) TaxID=370354 RepID=B0EPH6_ENTDS|nr:uncharacterized protein EDI_198100 [Entamoeba dispar SAW760]EDR23584.1 hypothetical protein EDI_198100 [Entamoeba dispar SAW760]|eukprot:EDR23584.1 hypothetical protein EDI_198100 [Entamoeba dispar SAW760]